MKTLTTFSLMLLLVWSSLAAGPGKGHLNIVLSVSVVTMPWKSLATEETENCTEKNLCFSLLWLRGSNEIRDLRTQ
jgi:hypothetical protein